MTWRRPWVIASVAASADGYIADASGSVGFLEAYDPYALGFESFLAGIDTVVLGRTTFEQTLGFGPWPYGGKRGVVVTSRPVPALPADVVTAQPTVAALAEALSRLGAGRVWLIGGPKTFALAHAAGLLDAIEIYFVPVTLGAGVALGFPPLALALDEAERFDAGVVRLRWRIAP